MKMRSWKDVPWSYRGQGLGLIVVACFLAGGCCFCKGSDARELSKLRIVISKSQKENHSKNDEQASNTQDEKKGDDEEKENATKRDFEAVVAQAEKKKNQSKENRNYLKAATDDLQNKALYKDEETDKKQSGVIETMTLRRAQKRRHGSSLNETGQGAKTVIIESSESQCLPENDSQNGVTEVPQNRVCHVENLPTSGWRE